MGLNHKPSSPAPGRVILGGLMALLQFLVWLALAMILIPGAVMLWIVTVKIIIDSINEMSL